MQIRMLVVTLGISAVIALMLAAVTPTFAHVHALVPANECAPERDSPNKPGNPNVGAGNEADPANVDNGVGQMFFRGGRGFFIPEDNPGGANLDFNGGSNEGPGVEPATAVCATPLNA